MTEKILDRRKSDSKLDQDRLHYIGHYRIQKQIQAAEEEWHDGMYNKYHIYGRCAQNINRSNIIKYALIRALFKRGNLMIEKEKYTKDGMNGTVKSARKRKHILGKIMEWPEISMPEVMSNERKKKKHDQMILAKMKLASLHEFVIHKIKITWYIHQ